MRRGAGQFGRTVAAACVAGGLLTATVLTARLWAANLPKPVPAEVYVKTASGPATPLRGSMTAYDDSGFTLHVAGEDRTLAWTDITPVTAFALRQKTIDRTNASDNLTLGRFGWALGAKDQATLALRNAVRLDASLKPDADRVLAAPPGAATAAATQASRPGELMTNGSPTSEFKAGNGVDVGPGPKSPSTPPPGEAVPHTPEKFHKATPEEVAAVTAMNRKQAAGVEARIGVKLDEFQTDHFMVFTDWDEQEYGFLRQNLEDAYRVVAKQFEADPKDNVFIGKLPVYMLREHSTFLKFAQEVDQWPGVTAGVAGYYMGNSAGFGHMAMWKPNRDMVGTSSVASAERLWAYVLTHEFTHAFLARYKSNVYVTRWLNEGIAEVIAYNQFPDPGRRRMAKLMAMSTRDFTSLFDDAVFPTGEYYPVMQSMAESLIADDKAGFLKLIDAIKDGTPPEQALQKIYHVDYRQFVEQWRAWARTRPDNG